jgi:hypothetical protein
LTFSFATSMNEVPVPVFPFTVNNFVSVGFHIFFNDDVHSTPVDIYRSSK